MYIPINPSFTIKVGCKGVFVTRTYFLDDKSVGVFFRLSKADNSIVDGPIWTKVELLLDIMHVL